MPFFNKNDLILQLNKLNIRLDKKRGQCFLIDKNIFDIFRNTINLLIKQIRFELPKSGHIQHLNRVKNKHRGIRIVEIGPGLGPLTDILIEMANILILIENDGKILKYLGEYYSTRYETEIIKKRDNSDHLTVKINVEPSITDKKIFIIEGDALKVDFPDADLIVGNIPYQISGPLFIKLLKNWNFKKALFMVQKEFYEHIVAKPNSSKYSRISAALGLYFDISKIKTVSKNCFFPVPKVDSVIIKLELKHGIQINSPQMRYLNEYLEFLRGIFPYKNKNLKNALIFYGDNVRKNGSMNPTTISKLQAEIRNIKNDYCGIPENYLNRKVRSLEPEELFNILTTWILKNKR